MNFILPLVVVHNPAKLEQQLEQSRMALKQLSYDQLADLLHKTYEFNSGVPEAQPWLDLISEEMMVHEDISVKLKEFAAASNECANNTDLLLLDHVKYGDECARRMDRMTKAYDALMSIARPLPKYAPHFLIDHIEADLNRGCDECWISSGPKPHHDCELKIARWFHTRGRLVFHATNMK